MIEHHDSTPSKILSDTAGSDTFLTWEVSLPFVYM